MCNASAHTLDPTPGTRQWWADFANIAAARAWCYQELGLRDDARKWQNVARDATAQIVRRDKTQETQL